MSLELTRALPVTINTNRESFHGQCRGRVVGVTALREIAAGLDAVVLTHADRARSLDVSRARAANTVSELLSSAGPSTLLVTELAGQHLLRLAELVDAPCLCLLGPDGPTDRFVEAAARVGTIVLRAGGDLAACEGRLRDLGVRVAREGAR